EGLSDIDGALTVSDISADHGTLTITEGGWTFTPAANYNGSVTLTYTVSDGQGGELSGQTRTFTLASVPDAPVAAAASFTIAEDGILEDSVVASDGDGDTLTY
ncbi:Ig-like domain-containing protein, partial [Asticcacaulis sp. AC402]|uniref:Ig-like domain-containing protein n=1 Tax=Asticcacaulis sp. AC402 TaxID=1282361 RepID=UPI00058FC0F8